MKRGRWSKRQLARTHLDPLSLPLQSPGRKTLLLDPDASTWLSLFADVPTLKEHGVDHLALLPRSPRDAAAPPGTGPSLFVARPTPSAAAAIAAVVKAGIAAPGGGARREYRALFAPRAGPTVRAALAAAGVLGSVAVIDLPIHFVPADADVLTLEDGGAPSRHARGHPGPAHAVAAGLSALHPRLGAPSIVRAVGPAALAVADALSAGRRAAGADAPPPGAGAVTEWILLDRAIDWATPLLTQLTYEGLVRETVPVVGGAAVVPGGSDGATTRVALSATDATFRSLRDLSFAAAGPALGARARALQAGYGAARGGDVPLAELKAFASALKDLPSVQRHVALAEAAGAAASTPEFRGRVAAEQAMLAGARDAGDTAAGAAEEALARGAPRAAATALRLLCLATVTGAPPSRGRLERTARELVATSGPEAVATLCGLDGGGLLRVGGGSGAADAAAGGPQPRAAFATLRRGLRLLADGGDPASPTDAAYVYAGYAPATVRFVEAAAATGGWAAGGVADAARAVGGAREAALRVDGRGRPVEEPVTAAAVSATTTTSPRTVLVAFIGGATSAEVAALRWLSARPGARARYLVASSCLVTGDDVVASFEPRDVAELAAAVADSVPR